MIRVTFRTKPVCCFAVVFVLLAGAKAAHSRPQEPDDQLPVYRCPGPPVLYTDDISDEEAARRSCRRIEGVPSSSDADGMSAQSNQSKSCLVVADMGFDIVARRSRGWSKEEQIALYRKQYADSDAMIVVNGLVTDVYRGAAEASSASVYRKFIFRACKVKVRAPAK